MALESDTRTDVSMEGVRELRLEETAAAGVTWRSRLRNSAIYIVGLIVLAIMVFPYFYMLTQSLAPWHQVNRMLVPSSLTLRSYEWIYTGGQVGTPKPWLRALFNSFLVTSVDTVSRLAIAGFAGYALSIIAFRGRDRINDFILFHMFYPAIILLVPNFLIIRRLGLYNTYGGMIVPMLVDVWAIFMYTNFFKSIPKEMIEAARIDGASELRIVWRIMVPLSRSITTVIALFLFMQRWIELMWDLIVVKDPTKQTLNVLLATMFGPYGNYPGPLYAAAVLLTFPVLILFIFFSDRFVQGIEFTVR
jgi:multiple sugar transport system permease protein